MGPYSIEQIGIAGPPIDDARLVAGRLAEADDAIVGAELGVGHLRRRNGFERGDLCVLLRQAQRGLRRREAREADFVAGAKLAHLPQLGLRDGGGADEAAERRAVGAEDHRHVAGEIDGADGVGVVVDVARMQPGFAAVFARPDGLRADEADAGRIGIVVNLPLGGEERVDVVGREEIRRAMRTVEHADVPGMGEARLQFGGERGHFRRAGGHRADMQHIAGAERAACVAAELAEREGRAAAEIFGHVDAAAHGDVGARAGAGHAAELQHLPGLDGKRLPIGHGLAVERRGELGAAEADDRVAVELERGAGERGLDRGGALVIADEPVGEPERQRIHRPRRRHADGPIAEAPRPILDRRLRAGGEDLDGVGLVGEGLQRPRQHLAAGEDVEAGELPEIIEIGLEAADLGRVECRLQLGRGPRRGLRRWQ